MDSPAPGYESSLVGEVLQTELRESVKIGPELREWLAGALRGTTVQAWCDLDVGARSSLLGELGSPVGNTTVLALQVTGELGRIGAVVSTGPVAS
jgi:hypothetical protein